MKFIINVIELAILVKLLWKTIKFFSNKKRRSKSMPGKIYMLLSKRIHKRLDKALKRQKDAADSKDNTVEFRVYRTVKTN